MKEQKIDNITDFLSSSSEVERIVGRTTQSHPVPIKKDSAAIYNKVKGDGFHGKENLGRLHIQIRQDLFERLLRAVFERKCDPKNRGASQRAVIEEALENHFDNG